jgi:hypothetical protein
MMVNSIVIPLEHEEQAAFVQYAAYYLPTDLFDLLWANPNGGKRHIKTAMDLRAEGVRAGVPDITFAYPAQGYHGLYIEMKRRMGGKVSEAQKLVQDRLRSVGYRVEVCRGCDEAIKVLRDYLGDKEAA